MSTTENYIARTIAAIHRHIASGNLSEQGLAESEADLAWWMAQSEPLDRMTDRVS